MNTACKGHFRQTLITTFRTMATGGGEQEVPASSKGGDEKERFTFFYRSGSPFSQWHSAEFIVDDITYNCAEQYMMHQKAVLFDDKEMADKILKSDSPKEQKAMGRKVRNFEVEIWKKKSYEIVKKGNRAKFSQNKDLLKALTETRGTTLVEASPRDTIWGIGLGAKNWKAKDRRHWRGKNLLGQILTEVREEFITK